MILRMVSILGVLAIGLCAAEKLDLPVPTCKRDSTDYSSCLKRAITEAWPLFVKGLPTEYEIPSLDPFSYGNDTAVFDSGDLHGQITFTNVIYEGIRATRIKAARAHLNNDTFRLEIDVRIPEIYIHGGCEAQGNMAGFRMGGKGNFNLTLENIRDTWFISGHVKDDTWIIEHFRVAPIAKNLKIYLNNFFEGNQEINKIAIEFVNEFWPPLYRVMLPVVAEQADKRYTAMLNRLFSKLSFSKVFP